MYDPNQARDISSPRINATSTQINPCQLHVNAKSTQVNPSQLIRFDKTTNTKWLPTTYKQSATSNPKETLALRLGQKDVQNWMIHPILGKRKAPTRTSLPYQLHTNNQNAASGNTPHFSPELAEGWEGVYVH